MLRVGRNTFIIRHAVCITSLDLCKSVMEDGSTRLSFVRFLSALPALFSYEEGVRMIVRPALEADFERIVTLYEHVVDAMQGSPYDAHWDMGYHPTEQALRASLASGDLFAVFDHCV